MALSIVKDTPTAQERMKLCFEQIIYGAIILPEQYGRDVFRSIPDGAIDLIDGDLRTAWDYVFDDAKAHNWKIEKVRIIAEANGEGASLEGFFADLLDRDLEESPQRVIKTMEDLVSDGEPIDEEDEERAAIIEADQLVPTAEEPPPEMEADHVVAAKADAILARMDALRVAKRIESAIPEAKQPLVANKPEEAFVPFPKSVMTGLAGDFAKLYSATLEAPAHFFYTAFLVCLGSLLSGKLHLSSEIRQQPRLFVLLLGESGDPRKSTAITKTIDFFAQAYNDFPVCYGVGSAEGLQGMMEKQNRVLLAIDEMKHFVSKCKAESSVLLPCVNTLFESNRYESHTKSSKVKLENAHLSLLAASTIETYENTWSAVFTDIGFNNRLWIVTGEGKRMFSIPKKISDTEKFPLRQRLGRLLAIAEDRGEIGITPEAFKIYDDWYHWREKSIHMKRLDTYALRLMPLLALNDGKTEVDAETVHKVLTLIEYQFQIRILHDPIDADNIVAAAEEKIRRHLKAKGPRTTYQLKKAVHYERIGSYAFTQAINNLSKIGDVGYDKTKKVFFLQPVGVIE